MIHGSYPFFIFNCLLEIIWFFAGWYWSNIIYVAIWNMFVRNILKMGYFIWTSRIGCRTYIITWPIGRFKIPVDFLMGFLTFRWIAIRWSIDNSGWSVCSGWDIWSEVKAQMSMHDQKWIVPVILIRYILLHIHLDKEAFLEKVELLFIVCK